MAQIIGPMKILDKLSQTIFNGFRGVNFLRFFSICCRLASNELNALGQVQWIHAIIRLTTSFGGVLVLGMMTGVEKFSKPEVVTS